MRSQTGRSRVGSAADVRPEDVPRHAGLVVRRMLLRRGILLKAGDDTPQLIADALLALYQASPPLPRSPLAGPRDGSEPPYRPRQRPARRPPARGAGCEPLFTEKDAEGAPD